jgi:hypothetical protein
MKINAETSHFIRAFCLQQQMYDVNATEKSKYQITIFEWAMKDQSDQPYLRTQMWEWYDATSEKIS